MELHIRHRHSRVGGNPVPLMPLWIPAYAGMTANTAYSEALYMGQVAGTAVGRWMDSWLLTDRLQRWSRDQGIFV